MNRNEIHKILKTNYAKARKNSRKLTSTQLEVFVEHVFVEPDAGVCVEKSFVKVVSHFTAILHLTNHVPHCGPRYALWG